MEVQLVDCNQWLLSCDDDALAAGENLAMIGSEMLQFGQAVALGAGRFRLSRLVRGRRGSEWAMGLHQAGDGFVLLDVHSLERVEVPRSQTGATVEATPRGIADSGATSVRLVVGGEAMRPPSPVHLQARTDSAGSLHCSWTRRSRLGWAWIDAVDTPLGVSAERYRLRLQGGTSALEVETTVPEASFTAADVASVGSGPVTLSVAQVGDLAVSRAAILSIS